MAVDIRDTFGAGFIGGMVAAILYGITTLQTYLYYVYYPRDNKSVKLLVALVWVIDTLHVSLMCHALYYYLVSNFGDEDALSAGNWSLFTSLGLNLCMAVLVQTIETVVLMFIKKEFSALSQITLYAATPFAVTAVLSDVFIAAALCVLLHGNRSPLVETNALVNTLIVYAINRCLLTSAVAVAEVIAFAVSPGSLWFIAIDFVIGKLYANSLLASLNSRSALRGRNHHSSQNDSMSFRVNTINLSDLQSSSDGDSSGGTQSKATTASARTRVKSVPGGDIDLLELGNVDRGKG
ncbi:uncharacterized protein EDB91DRAFT_1244132 [Suillus paluster]|uniref:uncharacterized protein n=1 Tax=Suillus paluster TaxID=48578 RepID=UPI001B87270B|nr:uncharacterized protein EDB91DRAFT_1244132 [Suillus paluster]KAG1750548.1 hypothetical protein EDB91DRAFT_1244132 [Suillus paluster]